VSHQQSATNESRKDGRKPFSNAQRQSGWICRLVVTNKKFKLKRVEKKEVKLDWRVEAMKLTKEKSAIICSDFLTLSGIPPEVFGYKLGNRSALEWVIDQYRVTKDEHGNITSDPNRNDDEEYIVSLIGKVIAVSLKTLKTIGSLPAICAKVDAK
jgi:predicted helicase